jgi:5-(carboxyamino)imidazole ribonucleotide mutase
MLGRIIMGSLTDIEIAKKVTNNLKKFDIPYQVSVISAHRALDDLQALVGQNDADVYIGIAGKAAHLPGVIAGMTIKPVIGVPVKSSTVGGLDSLLSIVQMHKGVPVATVALDGGENAAILATQILAVADQNLTQTLNDYKKELNAGVRDMNNEAAIQAL